MSAAGLRIETSEHAADRWPEVQRLLAETAMGGALSFHVTRPTSPERAYFTLGGRSVSVVALAGERVVGYAHGRIERRRSWSNGALVPEDLFLGGDLRVERAFRGRGVVRALFSAVLERWAALGVHRGFGLINHGNDKSLGVMLGGAHGQRTRVLRSFVTASKLLWVEPRPPSPPPLEAFQPTGAELEALPARWAHRFLAPAPPPGVMAGLPSRYPSLRFFRRTDDGRFATALWVPSQLRAIRLARDTWMTSLLRAAWRAGRPLSGAHPLPALGEELCTAELALTVREALCARALEQLAAEAHALGAHLLNVPERGLEPGGGLRVRGLCHRLSTRIVTYSREEDEPPACPEEVPVYLDLSIL